MPKRAVESRRKPRSIGNYYYRRRRTSGGRRQHTFFAPPPHSYPPDFPDTVLDAERNNHNDYRCCTQTQIVSLLFSTDGTLEDAFRQSPSRFEYITARLGRTFSLIYAFNKIHCTRRAREIILIRDGIGFVIGAGSDTSPPGGCHIAPQKKRLVHLLIINRSHDARVNHVRGAK